MGKPKKKRPYTGRDYHMVSIIKGANKAYVEKDQKKEASKRASRSKVDSSEIEYPVTLNCTQCSFAFIPGLDFDVALDELLAQGRGFCSVSCMDYYNESQE